MYAILSPEFEVCGFFGLLRRQFLQIELFYSSDLFEIFLIKKNSLTLPWFFLSLYLSIYVRSGSSGKWPPFDFSSMCISLCLFAILSPKFFALCGALGC